ncbi:hypothetical protein OJAV_G00172680 [Oryzias javanicus]|uniref:Uncharacterized protein n=1 Tax=Oryzias javanicus TaxID=123683 RepID=A0A3S2PAI1_ORYJA|nr:hypothetical protein OJAV_G00172680 [Oryzias javanicus]
MLLHPRIHLPFSPSPREEPGTPSLTRLLLSTPSEGETDAGVASQPTSPCTLFKPAGRKACSGSGVPGSGAR